MYNPHPTLHHEKRIYSIGPGEAGQRLDRYLATTLSEISRTTAQQMITDGNVLVNGHSSKSGYILKDGDEILVILQASKPPSSNLKPQQLALDIVYEDNDLLVINKPAGMVVHPAPGHSNDTLVNALLAYYPNLQDVEIDTRPGIVHRLDKDTSGLILVAKNARTQAALAEQMKRHEIIKRYLALVEGVVALDAGSIDAPIGRDPRHRQQMAVTATSSREARTHFRVLQRFARHTLLLLQLETGRTHQIRVHLKAIGHPIVGDPVYGASKMHREHTLSHQFLHAYQLQFVHPITGVSMELEAPLPQDLEAVIHEKNL